MLIITISKYSFKPILLVGQLDPTVDEKGRPTEQCINFTRYGYPINSGEPGYIDRNVPPSSFGRPPRDSGQYSIACDSRQDTSPYGNNTWKSGSCVDDAGRPCCINQTLEGYPIKIGDPRYVIQDFQREQCKNLDNLPPSMRDRPEIKQVCDLIAQESSTPPPGSPVTGPSDSPAQAELARATAARQEAEQQVNNAQTALASATAAQMTAEQQLTSVNMELETANSSLQLLEQQRSNAREKVASFKARRDDALRILNDARAKVAQLTGMEFVGDIHDSTADTGMAPNGMPPMEFVGDIQDSTADTGTGSGSLP